MPLTRVTVSVSTFDRAGSEGIGFFDLFNESQNLWHRCDLFCQLTNFSFFTTTIEFTLAVPLFICLCLQSCLFKLQSYSRTLSFDSTLIP